MKIFPPSLARRVAFLLTGAGFCFQLLSARAAGLDGDSITTKPVVINYEQSAGRVATVAGAGWFASTNAYMDEAFPPGPPDSISLETAAYLELMAGLNRFRVHSDDNFNLTAGPVSAATKLVLGVFDVADGRGEASTESEFLVERNGVYTCRPLHEVGQGGASLEFYSVDLGPSTRALINEALVASSIKAFRTPEASPLDAPPQIVNIDPSNNTFFANPGGGFEFEALATDGNTIDASSVRLSLNGVDVTENLAVNGTPTDRTASYNSLMGNTAYSAVITVTDTAGHTATRTVQFDTFIEIDATIVEAEDYNYASAFCPFVSNVGGLFLDDPAVDAFFGFAGLSGVDFSDTSSDTLSSNYRPCDPVGTQITLDAPRSNYAGTNDYELWKLQPGEWFNYTRTFTPGSYLVYLRASAAAARQLTLSRVTSDPTDGSQTTAVQGTFRVPNTGAALAYEYVPLADVSGNPVGIPLSDVQTLRLSSVDAANDVQANFLLFVPVTGFPPFIASASPGPGAVGVPVESLLQFALADGSTAVDSESIVLFMDGTDVTTEAFITTGSAGTSITYTPPTFFATGSVHTVRLFFSDNGLPASTITNQWLFAVAAGSAGAPLHVNFQASTTPNPLPAPYNDYAVDTGLVYGDRGNGLSYGWDVDNTANARQRNSVASPNILYDTFNHLNKDAAVKRIWEIAIANGTYAVHGVAGDPTATDSSFALTAEGVLFLSGVPNNPNFWVEGSNTVRVSDGRLTVTSQLLDGNNKINFLDITPLFNVIAPTISRDPSNAVVNIGGTATFAVSVRGSEPLGYQWLQDGQPIAGQTNATLTISNAQPTDKNGYSVTVSNSAGADTSGIATLTVQNGGIADVGLSISHSSNDVTVTWTNTATGWVLQQSTNLVSPINWSPTTHAVVNTNGNFSVTVPASGVNTFFQLKK